MKIVLVLFFIAAVSCNSKSKTKLVDNRPKNTTDTVVKDVPELFRADTMIQHRGFEMERQLGLNRIDNGFNEYQIRIWIYKNDRVARKGIVFKKDSVGWSSQFFEFFVQYDENWDPKSVDKKMETKIPKSGWSSFIEKLKATGIDTLHDSQYYRQPGTERSERYQSGTHPGTITVEIATPKHYRVYQYPDFYSNKDRFLDLGKFESALLLIEKEFAFKY